MEAVQTFARDTLDESDAMAVLCVLSHGLWNYVYGYDGKRVRMRDLIDCFSDGYCKQMKEKPKFVLMQTCQSGMWYDFYKNTCFVSVVTINHEVMSVYQILFLNIINSRCRTIRGKNQKAN